jgi:hypothetical protein
MAADIDRAQTKVYTTAHGRAVIEQSTGSVVVLSSEQILTVIEQLHACYDYCAAWKEPTQVSDHAIVPKSRR